MVFDKGLLEMVLVEVGDVGFVVVVVVEKFDVGVGVVGEYINYFLGCW